MSRKDVVANFCIESGCPGACCQNLRFTDVSAVDRVKLIPPGIDAIEIPLSSVQTYSEMVGRRRTHPRPSDADKSQVYYSQQPSGRVTVIFAGPCPQLQQDGSCGIYVQRPVQCQKFELGGKGCDKARRTMGLPLIATIQRRPGMK